MTAPADLSDLFPDVRALGATLQATGYLTDDGLATALFCAARLGQPLLLEGEAGVGKTEAAKALALAGIGAAIVREAWPAAAHWRAVLADADRLDPARLAALVPEDAVGRLAAEIDAIADGLDRDALGAGLRMIAW